MVWRPFPWIILFYTLITGDVQDLSLELVLSRILNERAAEGHQALAFSCIFTSKIWDFGQQTKSDLSNQQDMGYPFVITQDWLETVLGINIYQQGWEKPWFFHVIAPLKSGSYREFWGLNGCLIMDIILVAFEQPLTLCFSIFCSILDSWRNYLDLISHTIEDDGARDLPILESKWQKSTPEMIFYVEYLTEKTWNNSIYIYIYIES